jgi:hypothetical protein
VDVAVQAAERGRAGEGREGAARQEQADRDQDFPVGNGLDRWAGPGFVRPPVVRGGVVLESERLKGGARTGRL